MVKYRAPLCKARMCRSHFVDKLHKKGINKYLKTEYHDKSGQFDKVIAWCDKLIVITFDPADEMLENFHKLRAEARKEFNGGKRRNGKKGSLFNRMMKVWKYAKRTFINGTHSGVEELSCFEHPDHRSAQPIEGANKCKNDLMNEITEGGMVEFDHWVTLSSKLEKKCRDRIHTLHNHRVWKTKNGKLISKDKAYATICREYKANKDHDEFVRKLIKCNRKSRNNILPRGRRALNAFLESDSESE